MTEHQGTPINKDACYDMAMTTKQKIIQQFEGKTNEDVAEWTKDVRFMLGIYNLDGASAIRVVCTALQGKAFSWARQTITRNPDITVDRLLKELENRFASRLTLTDKARRFQTNEIPTTKEDYFAMLEDAVYLYDREYMSHLAIVDRIIHRSPPEIRIALWQIAGQLTNAFEIAKAAEQVVPLAYGNEGSMTVNRVDTRERSWSHQNEPRERQPESQTYRRSNLSKPYKQQPKDKFCKLHGECTHTTAECRTLKLLKEKGWSNNGGVREISIDETDNSDEALNFNVYSGLVTKARKNIFLRTGTLGGKQVPILLDTGADMTVVPTTFLPTNWRIAQTTRKIRAANDTPIPLTGIVNNMPIRINTFEILVKEALITSVPMPHILLGATEIANYPEILFQQTTATRAATTKEHMRTRQVTSLKHIQTSLDQYTIRQLITKYDNLFSTELTKYGICNAGKHSIHTTGRPIAIPCGRVPIHWETPIEQEIATRLNAGIIRTSNSPWCSRIVPVQKKDGSIRMCIDYRPLNKVTIRDAYPIPRIDEILDMLAKAQIFSTLDATSGYYQLAMNEEDIPKTAFAWKGGLYEFTRMPFGLCNAPATFQRAMDKIFGYERGK
ncbi:hypothetical protein PAPHI01_2723, partial [Pancytospora philotis]